MNHLIIFTCIVGITFVEGQFDDGFGQNQEEISEVFASDNCQCDDVFQPVCGQNGQTYSNNCQAECSKTSLACEGQCPCPESLSEGGSSLLHRVCHSVIQKVCAENGKTYDNACEAENHDVGVLCDGECPCPPNSEESCPTCCTTSAPECQGLRVDCSRCNR